MGYIYYYKLYLLEGFSPSPTGKIDHSSHRKSALQSEAKLLRKKQRALEQELIQLNKSCNSLENKLRMSQNDLRNKSFKQDKECENIVKVFVNFLKKNKVKLDLEIASEDDASLPVEKSPFAKKNFSSDKINRINGKNHKNKYPANINSEKKKSSPVNMPVKGIGSSQSYSNLNIGNQTYYESSKKLVPNQMASFSKFKNNRISNLNKKLKSLIDDGNIRVPNSNLSAISRQIPK